MILALKNLSYSISIHCSIYKKVILIKLLYCVLMKEDLIKIIDYFIFIYIFICNILLHNNLLTTLFFIFINQFFVCKKLKNHTHRI